MHITVSSPTEYSAALYIRLSKEDESEGPSQSITNQKSLLHAFVREHSIAVYDTYVDDGWSGTDFDRPGFQRMLGDIEAKKVNMVITKDLSRLGRDYIMTGHYMERYFPEKQVRYISLLDGIDTGVESTANDITPFRAIMNDMYAKDISRKIKSVKRDMQRKGQFIGGKPVYGYRMHPTEKNRIVVDPDAAAVVKRIFSMALTGISCRQIAVQLNAEKIPTPAVYAGLHTGRAGPYTGLWYGERISEMLQNETYIGNMVQGRRVKVSYKSKKCLQQNRENWVVVEGTHEPLVDRETFRKVGLLLDSRKHTRSRRYDFLLKGLLFCHECGHPMAVLNRKNAAGEDVLYFVCRTYQRFPAAGTCTSHTIGEKRVTEAVISRVREVCGNWLQPEILEPIALAAVEEARKTDDRTSRILELRAGIESMTANLDRVYMEHLNGILAEGDFERIYRNVRTEREKLEKRLADMEAETERETDPCEEARRLAAGYLQSVFTSRELLVSLIERVELTGDKQIIIRFRFGDAENCAGPERLQ